MIQSYGITSNKRRGVYKFFKFLQAFIQVLYSIASSLFKEDVLEYHMINQIWIRKTILI